MLKDYKSGMVIAVMMSIPVLITDKESEMLRFMLECSALRITGLNNNFSRDAGPADRSHALDVFVPEKLNPTFVFIEHEGRVIERFARDVLTRAGDFDVMFIEPSSDGKSVQAAWMCTEMKIFSFKSVPSGSDKSSSHFMRDKKGSECTIEFSCKTDRGELTKKLAADILDNFRIASSNPSNTLKIRFPL